MFGGFNYFSAMQGAIATLLLTYSPEFLRFGIAMTAGFAILKLAFVGYGLWFKGGHEDPAWPIAKALGHIAIAAGMIKFYSTPIPLVGVSFTGVILNQMQVFANVLDADSVIAVLGVLDGAFAKFIPPGYLGLLTNLIYYAVLTVLTVAKVASLIVISFGLIGEAVLVLVGPLFVPFYLVQRLEFLFWGWFKSLIQYAFLPVTGFAYILVGTTMLRGFFATMPPEITTREYPTWGLMVLTVVGAYVAGFFFIPSLNAGLFTGGGTHNTPNVARLIRR